CTTLGASSSISVTVASWDGIAGKFLPHACLGQLLNLLEDPLLLEPAQPVDEKPPREVIGLVAQRARHQSLTPHLARRAVAVEKTRLHPRRAGHHFDEVG